MQHGSAVGRHDLDRAANVLRIVRRRCVVAVLQIGKNLRGLPTTHIDMRNEQSTPLVAAQLIGEAAVDEVPDARHIE